MPHNTELRDVHAPALFVEGEVRWRMAAGAESVNVSVTATALHALGSPPLPAYLEVFEANRELLCRIASAKAMRGDGLRHQPIRIEREDVELVAESPPA